MAWFYHNTLICSFKYAQLSFPTCMLGMMMDFMNTLHVLTPFDACFMIMYLTFCMPSLDWWHKLEL